MKSPSPARTPPRPGGRAVPPILFAEDFDDPPAAAAVEEEPEPEPVAPMFSAGELEQACSEAHARGISAGLALTEESHRQAMRVALQSIAEALCEHRDQAAQVVEASASALARTVLATLCAALPTLCARHGETEARNILCALLPSLAHEPRVTVRVHSSLIAPLTAEIESLGGDLAGLVALLPADALLPGDVRVAWQHGAANRDTRAILGEIDDALGMIGLREAPPRAALHLAERAGRPAPDPTALGPIEELAHVG